MTAAIVFSVIFIAYMILFVLAVGSAEPSSITDIVLSMLFAHVIAASIVIPSVTICGLIAQAMTGGFR